VRPACRPDRGAGPSVAAEPPARVSRCVVMVRGGSAARKIPRPAAGRPSRAAPRRPCRFRRPARGGRPFGCRVRRLCGTGGIPRGDRPVPVTRESLTRRPLAGHAAFLGGRPGPAAPTHTTPIRCRIIRPAPRPGGER
jgi:hypothetical protein